MTGPGADEQPKLTHASDMASIRACVAKRCLLVTKQAETLLAEVERLTADRDRYANAARVHREAELAWQRLAEEAAERQDAAEAALAAEQAAADRLAEDVRELVAAIDEPGPFSSGPTQAQYDRQEAALERLRAAMAEHEGRRADRREEGRE